MQAMSFDGAEVFFVVNKITIPDRPETLWHVVVLLRGVRWDEDVLHVPLFVALPLLPPEGQQLKRLV